MASLPRSMKSKGAWRKGHKIIEILDVNYRQLLIDEYGFFVGMYWYIRMVWRVITGQHKMQAEADGETIDDTWTKVW